MTFAGHPTIPGKSKLHLVAAALNRPTETVAAEPSGRQRQGHVGGNVEELQTEIGAVVVCGTIIYAHNL